MEHLHLKSRIQIPASTAWRYLMVRGQEPSALTTVTTCVTAHTQYTLIILANLLRCVLCKSLTWWRNVDVNEIMSFTVHVTLSPCCWERRQDSVTWHCHHAAQRDAKTVSRDTVTMLLRERRQDSVTWHCHHAAERDAKTVSRDTVTMLLRETPRVYPSRDMAIQFARFESCGLQHLGYPSRESLSFADPWCEGVERTSAKGVEAAGPHHHRSSSDCAMV